MNDMGDMRNDRMEEEDTRAEDERLAMRDESMNRTDENSREDMRERDRERLGTDKSMPSTTREPVMASGRSEHDRHGMESDMWPDMTDLRQRFDAIQSEFIDDPKGAVRKADELVKEVVDRITRAMNERMQSMHHGVEDSNDTEQLRQTMRGYRDLVVWMEEHRAA